MGRRHRTVTKALTDRERHLKAKFGITEAQYDELLDRQKHRCAVCGGHESQWKMRMAVDHNHKTGEIRGLLCYPCNKWVVGLIDRYHNRIEPAMKYIREARTGWFVPKPSKPKRKGKARRS